MQINKELAIKILKYQNQHKDFYFPFSIICKELFDDDGDFVEVDINNLAEIKKNKRYKNFELIENLQDLGDDTVELMAKGFIEKIINKSLEKHISTLAKNYRKKWKEKLCESAEIEEYGLNEFIGGKAEAYEECCDLIKMYRGVL